MNALLPPLFIFHTTVLANRYLLPETLMDASSFFTAALIIFTYFNPALASCFTSIINFGDSLSDTGNYLASQLDDNVGRFPYGETYFHTPTGRFSDGRLMLDFMAEAMGIPDIPPFLGKSSDHKFDHGVNFAVGGATAIDSDIFWEQGFDILTNYSLSVQINWFKKLLPSLCPNDFTGCNTVLSKSVFIMGEIGGNDYFYMLSRGINIDEVKPYIPRVISSISSAINELINMGAKMILVPSFLPVGCLSGILTLYQNLPKEDYDHAGCIKWMNIFAEHHNQMLLEELSRLRHHHPSTNIIYVDNYNALANVFSNPLKFGFGEDYLSACCGRGGSYNFDTSAKCGSKTTNVNVCDDPSKYIIWDGMHFTEAAYKVIANQVINDSLGAVLDENACQIGSI